MILCLELGIEKIESEEKIISDIKVLKLKIQHQYQEIDLKSLAWELLYH